MQPNAFDVLLLLARPAAGKSEIIHYLKNIPVTERLNRFHLASFLELDDFPMLWTWFEEDALLEAMGHPRLHTDPEGYFMGPHLWNLLIKRLCLEYKKILRNVSPEDPPQSVIIEFSRGKEHGGFKSAFDSLCPEILSRAAILYVDVPWEESLRKNRKRFNPARPDSILEHGLPDEKLERLYRQSDWAEIAPSTQGFLSIQSFQVPYVVFPNHDDVTTAQGAALGRRLQDSLSRLWRLHQGRPD